MGCKNGVDSERLRDILYGPDLGRMLNGIREMGWHVAVHNDYTLKGEWYTFWLFTKPGEPGRPDQAVKGEGRTDCEALSRVAQQIHMAGILPPG